MALIEILQSRVKARKDDDSLEELIWNGDDDQNEAMELTSPSTDGGEESGAKAPAEPRASHATNPDHHDDSNDSDTASSTASSPISLSWPPLPSPLSITNHPQSSAAPALLSAISFGALATAHAALSNDTAPAPRLSSARSPSPFPEAAERLAGRKARAPSTRASKHAPTQLSTKKAVSRKRVVVPVVTPHARDPRFSSVTGVLDESKVKQNYAFLAGYRASEMAELRARIRAARDETARDELKRALGAMLEREKGREREERERQVLRRHRRTEREAVAEGKKPYFLKRGELKKEALVQRFEALGEKKAARVMERRRKKKAGKERKDMPRERRVD